ncbi:BON domain-containing protein [Methylosoma difficile]
MKKLLLLLMLAAQLSSLGCTTHNISDQEIDALSINDRRSRDALSKDLEIEADIKDKLADEQDLLAHSHIVTAVYNGKTLILGQVPDAQAQTQLVDSLRIIKNVKEVHNHLSIAPPLDKTVQEQDQAIKERLLMALSQIRTIDGFDASMVNVVVENGAVYVMGLVHRIEGNTVINVIRHQNGVQRIVAVFEYLN